jgi:RNA polymerase sigma factor (sigma-70 family)
VATSEDDVLRISEALDELALAAPRAVQVVEMRYFAGMTEREVAEALGVTERTVRRDWEKARLLLHAALGSP